jgi:hypothetical protein
MAFKYWRNSAGEYIRTGGGGSYFGSPYFSSPYFGGGTGDSSGPPIYMRSEECCCCCDKLGGPPTAGFSYAQTSGNISACVLSFTDESVAGTCGAISSWRWLKNGVEFSTSQNPTGVSVDDGDEITLEVTDAAGCKDSAVMIIDCEASCCDVVGGPPTADFSYTQIATSPCKINLHDESVVGTCGSIVAWRWLKNGVEFSTVQNPTNITVVDGDDITLEITDVSGCTDSVIMEIDCLPCSNGGFCGGGGAALCDRPLPTSVTVILNNDWIQATPPPAVSDCDCSQIGGSYNIPLALDGLGRPSCNGQQTFPVTLGPNAGCGWYLTIRVFLITTGGVHWRVGAELHSNPDPVVATQKRINISWDFPNLDDSGCSGIKKCYGTFLDTTPTVGLTQTAFGEKWACETTTSDATLIVPLA